MASYPPGPGSAIMGEKSYYTSGNTELATETPLTLTRLEPRHKLTKNSTRLVICLVGLPARGKSFVARKLLYYLRWTGCKCEIFNVGKYRREAYASMLAEEHEKEQKEQKEQKEDGLTASEREQRGACDASFFDAKNAEATNLRERVAEMALTDMLRWLDDEDEDGSEDLESSLADMSRAGSSGSLGPKLSFRNHERVAIFDATNSTDKRRRWVLEQCTSPERRPDKPTGVVFVESLCDDQELLEQNYRYKISSSPDFEGMNCEEALADLKVRVKKYEEQYETITDDNLSYIKVFNLSTKLMVNHVYGRCSKELVPALMSWHIGTRPVFLCRPGQTINGILTDGEDYVARNKINPKDFLDMSSRTRRKSMRGDSLGPNGRKFRDELLDFCYDEAHSFMLKRASVHDMAHTGTSISGLASITQTYSGRPSMYVPQSTHYVHSAAAQMQTPPPETFPSVESEPREPFPMNILTSTMPRATDTVTWDEYEFPVNQMSNLNPLDKGDFNGMELEEIKELNPQWYHKLGKDPYGTRFPEGESYRDLIRRLTPVIIDIEQQVIPTLVVSHVSILQCLMAYFRNTPVERCMSIEVPMHTIIKFTPVRGGGWSESRHSLMGNDLPIVVPPNSTMGTATGPSSSTIPPVHSSGAVSQLSEGGAEDQVVFWGDGGGITIGGDESHHSTGSGGSGPPGPKPPSSLRKSDSGSSANGVSTGKRVGFFGGLKKKF